MSTLGPTIWRYNNKRVGSRNYGDNCVLQMPAYATDCKSLITLTDKREKRRRKAGKVRG